MASVPKELNFMRKFHSKKCILLNIKELKQTKYSATKVKDVNIFSALFNMVAKCGYRSIEM